MRCCDVMWTDGPVCALWRLLFEGCPYLALYLPISHLHPHGQSTMTRSGNSRTP